jgi:hypothetical protein
MAGPAHGVAATAGWLPHTAPLLRATRHAQAVQQQPDPAAAQLLPMHAARYRACQPASAPAATCRGSRPRPCARSWWPAAAGRTHSWALGSVCVCVCVCVCAWVCRWVRSGRGRGCGARECMPLSDVASAGAARERPRTCTALAAHTAVPRHGTQAQAGTRANTRTRRRCWQMCSAPRRPDHTTTAAASRARACVRVSVCVCMCLCVLWCCSDLRCASVTGCRGVV